MKLVNDFKDRILDLFENTSLFDKQANRVHDLLDNKKIILYGAGDGFTTFLVFVLRRYGFKVNAVLDKKFKTGGIYFGIPAFSPFAYKISQEEKESAVVIITIGKKEYHKEIFNCLRRLGFKNVILSTDIYEYHLLCPSKELGKKGFRYYLENKNQIMKCLNLFADDLSREIFTRVIQTHILRKPITIPNRPFEEQYFPKDINLRKGYSRFINCGAYNGDTIKHLVTLFGKVKAVACFEPDQENFKLLTRYLCEKNKEIAETVISFPCGVFSSNGQFRFAGGDKGNSMISEKGEMSVCCVTLDSAIPGFNPTFLQMDIEGAELEGLGGAEATIRENQPDLAICVYHAPNHIWDIPIYIQNLRLGYKFYLRNYTSFISETVLYATT